MDSGIKTTRRYFELELKWFELLGKKRIPHENTLNKTSLRQSFHQGKPENKAKPDSFVKRIQERREKEARRGFVKKLLWAY